MEDVYLVVHQYIEKEQQKQKQVYNQTRNFSKIKNWRSSIGRANIVEK